MLYSVGRNHARTSEGEDPRDDAEDSYPSDESAVYTGDDSIHDGSKSVLESDVSPFSESEGLDAGAVSRGNDESSSFGIDDEWRRSRADSRP